MFGGMLNLTQSIGLLVEGAIQMPQLQLQLQLQIILHVIWKILPLARRSFHILRNLFSGPSPCYYTITVR